MHRALSLETNPFLVVKEKMADYQLAIGVGPRTSFLRSPRLMASSPVPAVPLARKSLDKITLTTSS